MKVFNFKIMVTMFLLGVALPLHATLITNTMSQTGNIRISSEEYADDLKRVESASSANTSKSSSGSYAIAEYGMIKIWTFGSTALQTFEHHDGELVNGFASAAYSDSITISGDMYENKKGYVTFDIYQEMLIDTNVSAGSLNARARYGLDFNISTPYLGIDSSRVVISAQSYSSSTSSWINGSYSVSGPLGYIWSENFGVSKFTVFQEFVVGTPLYFSLSMWADGHIPGALYPEPNSVTARYLVDAGNSSYWGGIQSVTIDGVEITDYQLSSESGTDYSRSFVPTANNPNPVPEPESLALFSLGIIGLFWQRRRLRTFG
ncbi:PEP-CTERM sorting domain-containing protein [Aliiglaciecola sp. CAU 1673]|uniref:PEP-CTERM sorting domain-containing protein n=1 Tax=Aliiglaciecola sp. CAU 1673 TaxID=3032595 RepID=UPI0023DCB0D4|nr:PEP-CTERM sorting domain-containing protein [Aliiglaciecola sp. CAU 1673]MDF2177869.1 PEP-CTERM sorting domain-containing protein [Aliiglaciecola sp. CAU 1673]